MLGLGVVSKLWNDEDLRSSFTDLVSKTVKAEVDMLQNSAEISYRLMRCGLQAGVPDREGQSGRQEETAEVVKDLIKVNMGYYSTLVDLNLAFTDRMLKVMTSSSPAQAAAVQTSPAVPQMALVGRVGEQLRVPFRVENNRAEVTTVSFHLTPFYCSGQAEPIAVEASFDPAEIALAPHQEVQIFLILPITPAFEPQNRYTATLAVEGMEAMTIEVSIEVKGDE
jgi:hypothetical protein